MSLIFLIFCRTFLIGRCSLQSLSISLFLANRSDRASIMLLAWSMGPLRFDSQWRADNLNLVLRKSLLILVVLIYHSRRVQISLHFRMHKPWLNKLWVLPGVLGRVRKGRLWAHKWLLWVGSMSSQMHRLCVVLVMYLWIGLHEVFWEKRHRVNSMETLKMTSSKYSTSSCQEFKLTDEIQKSLTASWVKSVTYVSN